MLQWSKMLIMACLVLFALLAGPAVACDLCGGDVIGVYVIAIDQTEAVTFDNNTIFAPANDAGITSNQILVGTLTAINDQAKERGGVLLTCTCSDRQSGYSKTSDITYRAGAPLHHWIMA